MKRDRTLSLISAVALVTLLAKVLGIAREALQARAFGTGAQADLYTVANNATIYLFTTAAYALCVAAVPILAPRLRRSREEGYAAADNLITITVLLALAVTALGVAFTFTPWAASLWDGGAEDARRLALCLRLMILTLPVIVLAYLLVALFQSQEHFLLQGSMSIPYNLALILFLALFAGRLGLTAYVAAVSAAWLLQLGTAVPYAVKEHYLPRFRPNFRAPYLPSFFKTAGVTVLTASIFLFCYLQDTAMAPGLTDSPVSAFYYADKLFTPLTTTLIYSISTVLFPRFSQAYDPEAPAPYRRYIGGVLRRTLLVILPASALLAVFARPIIQVLFQGGSFDSASTDAAGAVLSVYALSMAGFCALDLLSKAYYTMGRTLAPLAANGGILALNWGLNRLLGPRWGGAGLAAATALSLTAGGLLLALLLLRKAGGASLLLPLAQCLGAALLSGGGLWLAAGRVLTGGESKPLLVVKCGAMGALAAGLYLLVLFLVRQEDLLELAHRTLPRREDPGA